MEMTKPDLFRVGRRGEFLEARIGSEADRTLDRAASPAPSTRAREGM